MASLDELMAELESAIGVVLDPDRELTEREEASQKMKRLNRQLHIELEEVEAGAFTPQLLARYQRIISQVSQALGTI